MVDENSGVGSVPADEGAALQRELDAEIGNIKPEQQDSEVVKTPVEATPKVAEGKFVPYERFQEKVREVNNLKARNIQGSSPMDVVKLGQALAGHSQDEIDFIARNAKSAKIDDVIAASKDRMVRLAIEADRKEIADKKKVLGSSSPEFGGGGTADWKKIEAMKPAEFQKYEEEQLRGGQGI